jgi:DNA topoisomerase-1
MVRASESPDGLRYVDCNRPGMTRRRRGKGFAYYDCGGAKISAPKTLARIRALAIPPAYRDVWICPDPLGHLQAIGRDARGRKQYRYHVEWRASRDATKYDRLLAFGQALGKIRARVKRDMQLPGLPRDKVIAAVVHLLDITLIRVGNADYARDNHSYGLTTLRNRHVAVHAGDIRFMFRGKSGVEHDVTVHDPRAAKIIRRCRDLPGHELFQYLDAENQRHGVDSSAINAYLQTASGASFTAKDYRTWAGSVLALQALRTHGSSDAAPTKSAVVEVIKDIARQLGNTPAICRRCYVHPAIFDAYEAGLLQHDRALKGKPPRGISSLHAAEREFALFLARQQSCVMQSATGKATAR